MARAQCTAEDYARLHQAIARPPIKVITERDLIEQLQGPKRYSGNKEEYEWLRETDEGLVFNHIWYQGRELNNVELSKHLLDNGRRDLQERWLRPRQDCWQLPDSELLFQLMKRLYDLRQDPAYAPIVQRARQNFQQIFDQTWLITATTIDYESNSLEATVRKRSPLIPSENRLTIPIYNPLIIAQVQPSNQTPNPIIIEESVKPLLKALLGTDFERAPETFKYFSTTRQINNPNVTREIRLRTPNQVSRNNCTARAFCLGYEDAAGFSLIAQYIGFKMALGVRTR